MLILCCLPYGIHISISVYCRLVIHIADVHYRLVCKKEKVMCHSLFIRCKLYSTARLAGFEGLLVSEKQFHELLGILVSTCIGLFLDLCKPAFHSFEVLDL